MPSRTRLAAIALGLALVAELSAVDAQESDAPRRQGQTQDQQEPAEGTPFRFPVEVIEDQAAADARQRREERSEQRELDDLAAQQGMNEATQKMADYSVYQTGLVAIGTFLLFYTLWLTRQANRAAVQAANAAEETVAVTREMGEVQMRAYVFAKGATISHHRPVSYVTLACANSGKSPAKWFKIGSIARTLHRGSIEHTVIIPRDLDYKLWSGIGAEDIETVGTYPVELAERIAEARSDATGVMIPVVMGRVIYADIFDQEWESEFVFFVRPGIQIGDSKMSRPVVRLRTFEKAEEDN